MGAAPVLVVISLAAALLSQSVTVGADTMWLVAIGSAVITQGEVPHGVPFLATDTSHWVNVPVIGEVLMAALDRIGTGGLIGAQVIAVTLVMVALAGSAARLGAGPGAISVALSLVVIGHLPSLGIVRAQMWSLPLFVAVAYVLRRESESPSRWIWLVVPLTAIWGNLHGAVLVGVAVMGAYVLFGRSRHSPLTAAAVGLAVPASLWLTPAGIRSHEYYLGVISNAAAERREGLWAPVDLATLFGVLLLGSSVVLLGAALRRRLPLWEYAAVLGLTLLTIHSARNGIWLALWLAPRAALGLGGQVASPGTQFRAVRLVAPVLTVCAALVIIGLANQSAVVSRERATAKNLASLIGPVQTTLAVSPISELLAVEGVRLWASNPIDALSHDRQSAFLDFLSLRYRSAVEAEQPPEIIVLSSASPIPPGYHQVSAREEYRVYKRADSTRRVQADEGK